jgi:hypothetical protein
MINTLSLLHYGIDFSASPPQEAARKGKRGLGDPEYWRTSKLQQGDPRTIQAASGGDGGARIEEGV